MSDVPGGNGPTTTVLVAAISALGGTFLTEVVKQWVTNNQGKRDAEAKIAATLLERISALEQRSDLQRKESDDKYEKQRLEYEKHVEDLRARVEVLESEKVALRLQYEVTSKSLESTMRELDRTKELLRSVEDRCNKEHTKIFGQIKSSGTESE